MASNWVLTVLFFWIMGNRQKSSNIYSLPYPIQQTQNLNITNAHVGNFVNLNEILRIFQGSHFLVILTNFRRATFLEWSYPIILRYPNPVCLEHVKSKITALKCAASLQERNGSSILNISMYWRKMFVWNNLVSISLFPQVHLNANLTKYTYIDYYVKGINSSYNVLPSTVSPIKIFILYNPEEYEPRELARLISFLNSATNSYSTAYIVEITLSLSYRTDQDHQIFLKKWTTIQLCRQELLVFANFETWKDSRYKRNYKSDFCSALRWKCQRTQLAIFLHLE